MEIARASLPQSQSQWVHEALYGEEGVPYEGSESRDAEDDGEEENSQEGAEDDGEENSQEGAEDDGEENSQEGSGEMNSGEAESDGMAATGGAWGWGGQ